MLYKIMQLSRKSPRHLFIDLWNESNVACVGITLSFKDSEQCMQVYMILKQVVEVKNEILIDSIMEIYEKQMVR